MWSSNSWVWLEGSSDQNSDEQIHAHEFSTHRLWCHDTPFRWSGIGSILISIPERKEDPKEKWSSSHIGFTCLEMGLHMLPVTKLHLDPLHTALIAARLGCVKIQDPALICAKVVLSEVRDDFPRFELPCRPISFWSDCKTVRLQRRPPDFCWEGYDLRCNAVREQQQLFVYSTRLQRLFVQIRLIQSMQKTCSVKCSLLLCVGWSCVVCILFLLLLS